MAAVTYLASLSPCPLCNSKLISRPPEYRIVCTSESCLLHDHSIPREIAAAFKAVVQTAERNGYRKAMEDVIRVAEKGALT